MTKEIDIEQIVHSIEGAEFGSESKVSMWLDVGNYALNKSISNTYQNGLPFGRVIDIFGDPSTGKSLLIYQCIANIQKMGGVAILDDTEDAYTETFGSLIGIDNNKLIRLSSLTVEEHFEKVFLGWKNESGKDKPSIVDMILESNPKCPILVALDSVALLSTRHEQEVKFEKPDMVKAKQIRAGLRMSSPYMKNSNIIHLISNHVTAKMGVMFGPKTTTPGGSGIPFSASVRVELFYGGKIKDEQNNIIGVKSGVKIAKNRVASPFKQTELEIYFDKGLDPYSGLFDSLLLYGIVTEGESKRIYQYKELTFRKSELPSFVQLHPEVLL